MLTLRQIEKVTIFMEQRQLIKKAAEETMNMLLWKPFHFESNYFFDTIAGPFGWERLQKAYPRMTDGQLLAAKEATYGGNRSVEEREQAPNFGFRWEHDGEKTLRDFFVENGMMELLPRKE